MSPPNWPKNFTYSPTSVVYGVNSNLFFHFIKSPDPEDMEKISSCIEEQKVHPDIRIELLIEPHPLAKKTSVEHGVFALKNIPKETELGEYVGDIGFDFLGMISRQGTYTWSFLVNGLTLHIHSGNVANELTFVNDFRGIQDSPNVRTKVIAHRGLYYFGYATSRDIEAGEELLIDYGPAWAAKLKES